MNQKRSSLSRMAVWTVLGIGALFAVAWARIRKLSMRRAQTNVVREGFQLEAVVRSAVHDIRSPLQAMFSAVEALNSQDLDAGGLKAIQRIRRSTHALDAHLGDLVTILRIQSGELDAQPVSFEVGALMEELSEVAAPVADEMGLHLCVEWPKQPSFAFAEAALIGQALARMLSVAMKYAEQGEVRLSLDTSLPVSNALSFRVSYVCWRTSNSGFAKKLQIVELIAAHLGGTFNSYQGDGDSCCLVLSVPVRMEDPDAIPNLPR